jgi:hypothetical protein
VGDFAKDIGDKFRQVKTRVVDTYTDQQEARGKDLTSKQLVMEDEFEDGKALVCGSNHPSHRIRSYYHPHYTSYPERVETRALREDCWARKVSRGPQRREAEPLGKKPLQQPERLREPKKVWPKPEVRRSQPRQGFVKCWKCGQVGHISRGCWECGQDGHLTRNCPYIYHRESMNNAGMRGEPMKVNTTLVKRGRTWQGTSSESDTGSSRLGSDSEDSRRSVKIVSRKRGEGHTGMRTKLRTTCKED